MKKISAVLFIFFVLTVTATAQQALFNQDLSNLKVESLTDAEISSYLEKARAANLSEKDIIDGLIQKGLPYSEVTILQERILKLKNANQSGAKANGPQNKTADREVIGGEPPTLKVALDSFEQQIYGMELFTNPSATFNPDLRIATPSGYMIGPDDELIINVYGYSESSERLTVNPDGNILIKNVGPVSVNGLTMEEARSRIIRRLSTIYRGIATGGTKVLITLGNIRTIRVVVTGQARRPGSYTVSSLSTLFNVLFLCGGPSSNGTFRNIELRREGKKIQTVDLYKYLSEGDIGDNIALRDNDVINIPYYQARVKLKGEVKRPGYFEVQSHESLPKLMSYAGGFADSAYRSQIRVLQVGEKERTIAVIEKSQIASYQPKSGDEIIVDKILNRFSNRVTIEGSVFRPGVFDLSPGLTAKQLIDKADGLKDDAYLLRANLSRLLPDQTRQLIAFNPLEMLKGTVPDISLQREDIIRIASLDELRDSLYITVEGEVRKPNRIPFRRGMTLKDAIISAGGFTEAATGRRLEIGRRITEGSENTNQLKTAEILNIDTEKDFELKGNSVELLPFDILVVRNNPGYTPQKSVVINGEIMYGGKYILEGKDDHLTDVITRAGGFTTLANPKGASLKRTPKAEDIDTTARNNALIRFGIGGSNADSLQKIKASNSIGINLQEVLKNPHSSKDIVLEDGDVIFIPKKDAIVKVNGEVLFPAQLSYTPGEGLKYYISRTGGFSDKARKKRIFIISPNGNAKRTHHFLWFRNYPNVEAGDEIYVPKTPDKKGLSTGEVIGIASGLASLAGVVIAILNATR
jgi:protein involved in polysaccharide export with SLBB domain